jgi:sulfotransferase
MHLMAGLPRSGSTLLTALLGQNKHFQVTGTSGLIDVLLMVRAAWDRLEEHRAMPAFLSEQAKRRVLSAIASEYHSGASDWPNHRVAIDKSRSWLAHLDLAELLLGRPVKVLVPVRDVRDILASLELLWRQNAVTREIPWEAKDHVLFQSAAGRCQAWTRGDGILGIAYNRLYDALRVRGWADRLLLIPFESFTRSPKAHMELVHGFLNEPPFAYDFDEVGPPPAENDLAYGVPGLHRVRNSVRPVESRWRDVLGDVAVPYGVLNRLLGYPEEEVREENVSHDGDLDRVTVG